ncbi:hypothetical protein Lesp02_24920 [Lentzea sp. NBRC 105346]|uniref:hypothetical protein n=1 Tax=Lentzea sp. NBRC 105346 TaxID=3032205 RepID=UPI002553DB89|nr:hypothetical protein [Lentzea sp. NBRC 105346]GLZ30303.1 hypothetical protein Lesp02_24920 [Lentzea sp. NBRC 105346]
MSLKHALVAVLIAAQLGVATTEAAAAPPQPAPVAPAAVAMDVPEIEPVTVPADGQVDVKTARSKALQPIDALPHLDPAPGTVPVDRVPVKPQPPYGPYPLTMPQRPGQELVDATAADALATLGRAGRLTPDGKPDLDPNKLQPQVPSAQVVDPSRPATLQELIDALTSGNIPPPLPVDPLALLQQLPDGLPRITYRVCSESRTKQVSCSLTLPLAVPAIVDVTGDRTPDVLADLVPAAGVGDVVSAAREVLDLERQIAEVNARIAKLLELIANPENVLDLPVLIAELTSRRGLLALLTATLQEKITKLLDIVHLGLGLVTLRLPTSEHAGADLPAHVWAVYDVPTHKRLSLGFDGFRRGSSLATAGIGVYTFSPTQLLRGIYDIKATLLQIGAGESMAVTAGLASVREDDRGEAYDATVASARFSPVPTVFAAHAFVDPGAADRDQKATVDARSDKRTHLDTQVLSPGRFDQLKADELPTSVQVALNRPKEGGEARVDYRADSTIDDAMFADFVYDGQGLDRAVLTTAKAIPATWNGVLKSGQDKVTLDYQASSSLQALDAAFYDRDPSIVLRGKLRGLPTKLNLLADQPASHVNFTGEQALGSAEVALSRNLGAFAPLDGDHATLITKGAQLGASARVTGMKSVDLYYDAHPRLKSVFEPGGQAFTGAGDIEGVHKARLEISNLPKTLSLDADTAARKIVYEASEVIHRAHVGYTNTQSGPTVFAAVHEVPAKVTLNYDLGEKPKLRYEASSRVAKVELFGSPQHIENLRPEDDQYLSAVTVGVPKLVDVLVDLPAKHLQGELESPMDSVAAVARFPMQGRDWTAIADLAGVPAKFDADWPDGTYRFRGITGPLGSARLAINNHRNAIAPKDLHLAVHYRQSNGDLDVSAATRNLSHVEYSRTPENQTFRLDTDTAGAPVFTDVDVLLDGDLKLAALGRIDNLPSTLRVDYGGGKLTYGANKRIGLALGVQFGKVAALNGNGAPLFGNGVAASARGCQGDGCVKDEGTFCKGFTRCFGVVGTINLSGLPTSVVADLGARSVVLTGYQPPQAPLEAYLRLDGLLADLPDFRAKATLSGVPSPLDLTVGPISVGTGLDVGYTASAPLGALQVDVDTTTTNQTFPVLRGRATVSKLPSTMRITGTLGDRTSIAVRNSAPIDGLGMTITGTQSGYLQASLEGLPATADVFVDVPAKHSEVTMSAPIRAVTALLRDIPVQGRRWSAYLGLTGIPAKFQADFGNGRYRFSGESGPLGSAAFAVTNHDGATSPVDPSHLAAHANTGNGDLDASLSVVGLRSAEYAETPTGFKVNVDAAQQAVTIDGNAISPGDIRYGVLGRISDLPGTVEVSAPKGGPLTYTSDKSLELQAKLWFGKVNGISAAGGAPKFDNGIALVEGSCAEGQGCPRDDSAFCNDKGCYGMVGFFNLVGLPTKLTADLANKKYGFEGLQPAGKNLQLYLAGDKVFSPGTLTGFKTLVDLVGLPSPMTFTLGPINTGDNVDVQYTSNIGSNATLKIHAEASGVPLLDTLRAKVELNPIPASVHVTGKLGATTNLTVDNAAPVNSLSLRATGTYGNSPASGELVLTGVPAKTNWQGGGFTQGTPQVFNMPTLKYQAWEPGGTQGPGADTLSGSVKVEAKVAIAEGVASADDLDLQFDKLGHDTTITVNRDEQRLQITSTPVTGRLRVGGNLAVEVPRAEIEKKRILDCWYAHADLYGHFQLGKSKINDLYVELFDVKTLIAEPGKPTDPQFPPIIGYLFQAFNGDYNRLEVSVAGVELDVDFQLKIDTSILTVKGGLEVTRQGRFDQLRMHRYDLAHESKITIEIDNAPDKEMTATPGLAAEPSINRITVPGGSPQMIAIIEPTRAGDDETGLKQRREIMKMLAHYVWPFGGGKIDAGEGGC